MSCDTFLCTRQRILIDSFRTYISIHNRTEYTWYMTIINTLVTYPYIFIHIVILRVIHDHTCGNAYCPVALRGLTSPYNLYIAPYRVIHDHFLKAFPKEFDASWVEKMLKPLSDQSKHSVMCSENLTKGHKRTKLMASFTKLNANRVLLCTLVTVYDHVYATPEGQSKNLSLEEIMSLQ